MTALKIASEADEPDPRTPSAEMYDVSPAIAKRWLARNVRNRIVSQADVAKYARDMAADAWHVTGEAIKFDTNGAVADGQHRLLAVIRSGKTVRMLIVRGVAPDTQAFMDSGRKRSVAQNLSMNGRKDASILEAAARFALSEPAVGFVSDRDAHRNISSAAIYEFIETYEAQIVAAAEVARHYYPAMDISPSVSAVAWMVLREIDPASAGEFWSSIADSRTEGAGDPRLALIRRLASMRRNNERKTQLIEISLLYRAWNLWRQGKTAQSLPTHIGGQVVKVPERLR